MTPRHLLAISLCGLGLSMPAAAADTVIAHVTLIDGTGGPTLQDAWVHVADDRVSAIGTGAPPKRGDEIDGTGKFLIPGLIDSHVHIGGGRIRAEIVGAADEIAARRAAAVPSLHGYLYSGVTSVYDSGNFEDFIFPMRDAERAGEIVSPRIFATGGVVAFPRGYGSGPGATLIGSEEDFDALDRHLDWEPRHGEIHHRSTRTAWNSRISDFYTGTAQTSHCPCTCPRYTHDRTHSDRSGSAHGHRGRY